MRGLRVSWDRLVHESGEPARAAAGQSGRAASRGSSSFGDAGPPLDTPLSTAESVQEPVASNENLIAGYPLEGWLGVETRESPCCVACCGADLPHRGGRGQDLWGHPVRLIVRAGFTAAPPRPRRG